MRLEHHLVGGYVRYISPHIIIINLEAFCMSVSNEVCLLHCIVPRSLYRI